MKSISFRIRINTLIPGFAVLFSVGLFVFSLNQEPAQAYSFPDLFVGAMVFFSLIWLIQEVMFSATPVVAEVRWIPVVCGLIIIIVYLITAQIIGFLLSSLLVFSLIGIAYSPVWKSRRNLMMAIGSSILFMAVIYLLFTMVLKVQVPTGIF